MREGILLFAFVPEFGKEIHHPDNTNMYITPSYNERDGPTQPAIEGYVNTRLAKIFPSGIDSKGQPVKKLHKVFLIFERRSKPELDEDALYEREMSAANIQQAAAMRNLERKKAKKTKKKEKTEIKQEVEDNSSNDESFPDLEVRPFRTKALK